jgi:hypothetical protein
MRYAGPDADGQVQWLTARALVSSRAHDEAGVRLFSQRSVEMARDTGNPILFQSAARYRIEPWLWSADQQEERLALAEELLTVAGHALPGTDPESGPPRYNSTAHFNLFGVGDILLVWGQRRRAEALWTSNLEERLEYSWTSIIAQRNQMILACLDGRLEQAFEVSAALVHNAELLGAGPYGRENASMYVRRPQLYVGRANEALSGFHPELDGVRPSDMPVFDVWGMYAAQRAVCLAHAGRMEEARAILERFCTERAIGNLQVRASMPISLLPWT